MIFHSSSSKRTRLEQDLIGNGHFANVMQDRPAADMDQVRLLPPQERMPASP